LSGPLFAGIIDGLSIDSRTQLLAVGDALVLVASLRSNDYVQWTTESETFIYLIEPQTGKARLAWKNAVASPLGPRRARSFGPPRNADR
jgi:hypothetical protein